MPTMLYTRDGLLAADVRAKKGVFDRYKVATFYHVFDDSEVPAAMANGWLHWNKLLEEFHNKILPIPEPVEKKALSIKHRGHGKWDVIDEDGNIVMQSVTKDEALERIAR